MRDDASVIPGSESRGVGTGTGLTLGAGGKLGLFWRSLLLQSAWNPRGMQHVGFCFAVLPVLRRRRLDGDAAKAFLERHLEFFNTNPTMATYIIGAVAAGELEADEVGGETVADVKKSLSGPLGMAGDALLWGSLRPLAGLAGVMVALLGHAWAAVALLVLYNVPHLSLRARGIAAGVALGPAAAREVLGPRFKKAVRVCRAAGAFTAGIVLAVAFRGSGDFEPWRLVASGGFFALAYAAARLGIPATVVGLAGAVGGLVLMVHGS